MKKVLTILIVVCAALSVQAQNRLSGKVSDVTGDPIPGANVFVKGTTQGTITDLDGKYTLNDVAPDATMVVSFIGFKTQEVQVNNQSEINVTLTEDAIGLEEVVAVGYGQTQNKRTVSTAVTTVDSKHIEKLPVTRPEQALQGSAPGIVIIQESGSPGAPLTIRMRGVSTAGDATPLIMVNGVQVPDMNFINSNDIKNIVVLKDAASTAIYGSRGGNGVILVETKSGKRNAKKTSIDFSAYYGVQSLASSGDYLNFDEYVQYYNNSVEYYKWRNPEGNLPGRDTFTANEIATLEGGTDWIDEFTEVAPMSDFYMNVTGGTEKTAYALSGGLLSQEGIIGGDQTKFKRGNIKFTYDIDLFDNVDVNLFAYYTMNNRNFIAENSENSFLMTSVMSMPPVYPIYDDEGVPFNNGLQSGVTYRNIPLNSQAELGNPIINLNQSDNKSNMDVLFGGGSLNWKISNLLKFSTNYSYLSRTTTNKNFNARYDYSSQSYVRETNSMTETFLDENFQQWEGYFTITPELGDGHDLNIIAGTSLLENNFYQRSRSGANFIPNTISEVNFSNIIDDEDASIGIDQGYKNTTASFYTRANYTINQKYLFGVTLRADGSSKFSEDNKWGYFPSFSAGWVLSEEDFMADSELFTLLKVRGSWGINGNDRIDPYQYIDRYQKGRGTLAHLDFNEDIKWEEISQINFGLDMNMFDNRLGITLDYYQKTTDDMLLDFPNPGMLGQAAPTRNAAEVSNEGIEVMISHLNTIGDLSYNIGFNLGYNTNEVKDLGGGEPIEGANTRIFQGAPNLTRTDEGHPIASFYGYQVEGLDEFGDLVYVDQNDDTVIEPENDRVYIGNPYPDYTVGITGGLEYKGFDFSFFFQGAYGHEVVNAANQYGFAYTNRTTKVLNAWMPGNETNIARPSALEVTNHQFSDYYVEDGSYMRLKNVTLGYTLPKSLSREINMSNVRVYVSGQNLITFTDYSGLDPEIGMNDGNPLDVGIDRAFYPAARTVLGGIQISF